MEQTPAPSKEVYLLDTENGHDDDGEEEEDEATLRASTKSVDMECDTSSRKSPTPVPLQDR